MVPRKIALFGPEIMLSRLESAADTKDVPAFRTLFLRRVAFSVVVLATIAALLVLFAKMLSPGGLSVLDIGILVLFAVTLPATVIGFWNAAIGFVLMRFSPDPVAAVCPAAAAVRGDEPIQATTAILLCIRNEEPGRILRNLRALVDGLALSGAPDRFHVYVLSDTSDPTIAAIEEDRFSVLASEWQGRIGITYRRRTRNTGFKAGNVRDFCERWGHAHDFAVTLDADSFMPADAVLRLVRVMQADPRLGILQGLVVGMPSTSAFARVFQFGMRLGMRSYTIGSAWWQGDCGPYWGHNAILRLAPFIDHCDLPMITGHSVLAGHIMSHDQIEAVLMRRAGYEVRVLPEENLGWEENPPTLTEFIRRDLRWCQGNMQYWRFLTMPGLRPVSRYQLAFALLMFLGSPAWMGMLVLGTVMIADANQPADVVDARYGMALFAVTIFMWFAPKIASVVDVLMRREARRAFGGGWRFLGSVMAETVFSLMLTPIMWFGHTAFFAALLRGKAGGWGGQLRDDHAVPVRVALRQFWGPSILGCGVIAILAARAPSAIPYALFIAGGLAAAVPLAVLTADARIGRALTRIGMGRLPEETEPSAALASLQIPAVDIAQQAIVRRIPQCSRA
jgi:membrane glycosyltransferase